MTLCPVCGRHQCDHTPEERGQTDAEMCRLMNSEELAVLNNGTPLDKLRIAIRYQHYPEKLQDPLLPNRYWINVLDRGWIELTQSEYALTSAGTSRDVGPYRFRVTRDGTAPDGHERLLSTLGPIYNNGEVLVPVGLY